MQLGHLVLDVHNTPGVFSTTHNFPLRICDGHVGANHSKWRVDVFIFSENRQLEIYCLHKILTLNRYL